jgi:hypothetical protein
MGDQRPFLRRNAARLAALVLAAMAYAGARLPAASSEERRALATRFAFRAVTLPGPAQPRHVRSVHPQLERISAWISSVGAGAALADFDGDGLPNDLCLVEVRDDSVQVLPVPEVARPTGAGYARFTLRPPAHLYDPGTMAPMGCLPADLDEDGRLDALVYYWGRTPLAFMRRGADLDGAAFVATEITPAGSTADTSVWYTNAGLRADLDGDGHLDLLFGNYFQDGAKVLVPPGVDPGVPHLMQTSMARAFNGGAKHLFLCHPESTSTAGFACQEVHDYLDAPAQARHEALHGWTLAAGAADLDGDLLPELYFAHDFGPDRLLYNLSTPGRVRFRLVTGHKTWFTPNSKVLGQDSFKGMGVDFGDVNGDGRPDIYVSNITTSWGLEESQFLFASEGEASLLRSGRAPYADRGEVLGLSRTGWGWDARLADFDNDGVLEAVQATGFVKGVVNRWPEMHELAMGNDLLLPRPGAWLRLQPGDDLSGHEPNAFFTRDATGRFVDVAAEVGLGGSQVTRALALGDVDGDGDEDLVAGNQWEDSHFYRNEARAGAFLGLDLLRPTARDNAAAGAPTQVRPGRVGLALPGVAAVGASVRVRLPAGHGLAPFLPRLTQLVAEVDGGNGHSGKRSPAVRFGLGALPAQQPLAVEVRWRDAAGQVRCESLALRPGWYTVRLGQSAQGGCHVG